MFSQFWLEESQLAPNSGYAAFGFIHLGFLGLSLIIILVCYREFSKLSKLKQLHFLKIITWTNLGLEILRDLYLVSIGKYAVGYWPLHLCGLALFIHLAFAYSHNKILGEVSFALILPSAAAALLFPNWLVYPAFNIFNLSSYLIHTLLILNPILCFKAKLIFPKFANHWMITLFLLFVTPFIYLFNTQNGTNFFFINYPLEGTPLELFANWLGNPGYLVGYALLVFLGTSAVEILGYKIDTKP